ncbi:uncharacterized protein [Clytia hemisphaerica]
MTFRISGWHLVSYQGESAFFNTRMLGVHDGPFNVSEDQLHDFKVKAPDYAAVGESFHCTMSVGPAVDFSVVFRLDSEIQEFESADAIEFELKDNPLYGSITHQECVQSSVYKNDTKSDDETYVAKTSQDMLDVCGQNADFPINRPFPDYAQRCITYIMGMSELFYTTCEKDCTFNTFDRMKLSDKSACTRNMRINFDVTLSRSKQSPGISICEANIVSNIWTGQQKKTVKEIIIQERITGFELTSLVENSNYPSNQTVYPVSFTIATGTDVTLFAYVENYEKINSTDSNFVGNLNIHNRTGPITIYGEAYNGVSHLNNSWTINIWHPIKHVKVWCEPPTVLEGEEFTAIMAFRGGSKVNVTFDTFAMKNETLGVLLDGGVNDTVFINVTKRFDTCGVYKMEGLIRNPVSPGQGVDWQTYFPEESNLVYEITVVCPISNLVVDSNPPNNTIGNTFLDLGQKIYLDINIEATSSVQYNISWGDGKEDSKLQEIIKPFRLHHVYTQKDSYTITVLASNGIKSLYNSMTVEIKSCVPTIHAESSSAELPLLLTVGTENFVKYMYQYEKIECEKSSSKFLKVQQTRLFGEESGIEILNADAVTTNLEDKVIIYKMDRNTNKGNYTLTLDLAIDQEGTLIQHILKISLVNAAFFAVLANSDAISISRNTKKHGVTQFYEIEFDASGSYDAENRIQWTDFEYRWYCQLNDTSNLPDSLPGDSICLPENRTQITTGTNKQGFLYIDSSKLLANQKYQIIVEIEYNMTVVQTVQLVTVLDGVVPVLTIKCVSNCQSAVNPLEKVMLEFECKDCSPQDIESIKNIWKIADKENNGTSTDFIIKKQNEQSIEIDPGTFKHGKTYDVSLTASYPEGTQSSEASYSINVAVVPEAGMCTVVPSEGIALETDFLLSCKFWKNEYNTKLQYKYFYRIGTSQDANSWKLLNPTDNEALHSAILPAGLAVNDYKVAIKPRVFNVFGAFKDFGEIVIRVNQSSNLTIPTVEELSQMDMTTFLAVSNQLASSSGSNTGDIGSNFGSNTGSSGSNTGSSGSNTGNSGSNTGHSGSNTGNSGSNTGSSGSNTGNSGSNTGNNADSNTVSGGGSGSMSEEEKRKAEEERAELNTNLINQLVTYQPASMEGFEALSSVLSALIPGSSSSSSSNSGASNGGNGNSNSGNGNSNSGNENSNTGNENGNSNSGNGNSNSGNENSNTGNENGNANSGNGNSNGGSGNSNGGGNGNSNHGNSNGGSGSNNENGNSNNGNGNSNNGNGNSNNGNGNSNNGNGNSNNRNGNSNNENGNSNNGNGNSNNGNGNSNNGNGNSNNGNGNSNNENGNSNNGNGNSNNGNGNSNNGNGNSNNGNGNSNNGNGNSNNGNGNSNNGNGNSNNGNGNSNNENGNSNNGNGNSNNGNGNSNNGNGNSNNGKGNSNNVNGNPNNGNGNSNSGNTGSNEGSGENSHTSSSGNDGNSNTGSGSSGGDDSNRVPKPSISKKEQDAVVKALDSLTTSLASIVQSSKVGAVQFKQATAGIFDSLSTTFDNSLALQEYDHYQADHNPNQDVNTNLKKEAPTSFQAGQQISKLVECLGRLSVAMGQTTVILDKPPVKVETKLFALALEKHIGTKYAGADLNTNDGSPYNFKLPSNTTDFLLPEYWSKNVVAKQLNFAKNIFSTDPIRSKFMKTKINGLEFQNNGQQIAIKNITKAITIAVESQPTDSSKSTRVSLYLPSYPIFETVRLQNLDCPLVVTVKYLQDSSNEQQSTNPCQERINEDQEQPELTVLMQYGQSPTTKEYDYKALFPAPDGVVGQATNDNNIVRLTENTFLVKNLRMLKHINQASNSNNTIYFSFTYNGTLPNARVITNEFNYDTIEFRSAYNYSLDVTCRSCMYWNKEKRLWDDSGVEIDVEMTTETRTYCKATHLTSFGGLYIAPNPIPTPSFQSLKEGYTLLVTVLSLLLVYILAIVFVRKRDRNFADKVNISLVCTKLFPVVVRTG